MSTLSQNAMTVARNPAFQDRIRFHLNNAAIQVMAEDPATAGHEARRIYAGKVLDGTANYLAASIAVLSNTTIQAQILMSDAEGSFGIGDADLPFVVNSVFNALAGV